MLHVPETAHAVWLFRIAGDRLIGCQPVAFKNGADGVDTTLRRAAISGRVEIGGEIENHFADLLDERGDMLETVALDAGSYKALKQRWMRTKVELQP